jgi:hypothetical protein
LSINGPASSSSTLASSVSISSGAARLSILLMTKLMSVGCGRNGKERGGVMQRGGEAEEG